MTLRHIRREPKLGFWAWLFDRKPAVTYCGAPITGRDLQAVPRTVAEARDGEVVPVDASICIHCCGVAMLPSERAAEIQRAVDSPN